jgi:hypothetical protein
MAAERTGLLGRAYIDIANRDNVGDPWLEDAARQVQAMGFDTSIDREPGTMPATVRIDAPVLYFGWYSGAADGPFLLPGFRFAPGAIAVHIHSFSAATLRLSNGGWTGPFVARGVTATVGNVNEPYLQFTHPPHLLLRALARGATLVDAAYFALPALSWQAILIGDPLYRPFAVPLEKQLEKLTELPAGLAAYAILRRMRLLDTAGRHAEATALGMSAQREVPGLAVGVALGRRSLDAGEKDAAGNALGFAPLLTTFEVNEWALAAEAAQLLETAGRPGRATEVWRKLFAAPALPSALRLAWLPSALKCAGAARDEVQLRVWQAELAGLTAPAGEKRQ